MGSQRAAIRGALIVIEGCDRVGKSTSCTQLVKALLASNVKAELVKFPDRSTKIGSVINDYLQGENLEDHAVHLLFSANRWERKKDIVDKLEKGITLVVDRYAYSGAAYTAAKKGFDLTWCMQPDVGLPRPDLVIFLDLDPAAASKREGFGEERYETTKFQNTVRDNFLKLKEDNWKIIDANAEQDAVHKKIMDVVMPLLENTSELKKLWIDKVPKA